jgi:cytoskeletal protein CcmA (bactofilin family)
MEEAMWKRDENVRSTSGESTAVPQRPAQIAPDVPVRHPDTREQMETDIVHIGMSVIIKGELRGSEDLTVEGQIEGTIHLHDHVLTIGPNARIKAEVFAKAVIILGEVTGDVTATDKVDIRDNGSVDGNIIASRVAISEAAHFRGSVDMQRKSGSARPKAAVKPTTVAPLAQPAAATA